MRDLLACQPITQGQQIGRERPELFGLLLDLAVGPCDHHTGHDAILVNIQSTTTSIQYLHISST